MHTVFPPLRIATPSFPKLLTVLAAMLPGTHTAPAVSPRVRTATDVFFWTHIALAVSPPLHTAQAVIPRLFQEVVFQQRHRQWSLKLLLCRVVSMILSPRSGLVRTPTSSQTLDLS